MATKPTRDDKFSFGLWTIGYNGSDPFGGPTRPALDVVEAVEVLDGLDDVEVGAGRAAERVGAGVADRPESEGELVVARGGGGHRCPFPRVVTRRSVHRGEVATVNVVRLNISRPSLVRQSPGAIRRRGAGEEPDRSRRAGEAAERPGLVAGQASPA